MPLIPWPLVALIAAIAGPLGFQVTVRGPSGGTTRGGAERIYFSRFPPDAKRVKRARGSRGWLAF